MARLAKKKHPGGPRSKGQSRCEKLARRAEGKKMEMGRTCMAEAGRSLVKSSLKLGATWWGTAAWAPGYTVGRRFSGIRKEQRAEVDNMGIR